ncbi:glycosyltransferase [Evansella cellulosilytica]|uniref:Glycosyl transferase family 2 n=1 Tax=Evansella cellulosilytica (strain ATCC 21833 / DSM 2522 / FERM P-1141 / JCM 9156 / N-4) TaxID=649639 RepID=E6TWG1_EVAC2|nr:glycosyltransferase family 2 protein [Evansella cellulosilytica]ADU32224.1 glycosyl transferase family 2 [Evansella cellulosilytica DSM 2522]
MLALFIVIQLAFLVWVLFNSFCLPKLPSYSRRSSSPLISVLIPMRNEERNVAKVINNLKALTYQNFEVIILDDHSEDDTKQLLQQAIGSDNRFKVIDGKPLPQRWVGKVFACHQLALEANGDYFLFLDADVSIHENTLERTLRAFHLGTGLITGFPKYPVKNFFSHLLVPMQHFIVHFHLPIFIANNTKRPAFTAAHGAFMMFKRDAYEAIKGHYSVKNSLVEDIHIAREVKKTGYYVRLMNISDSVSCFMYESNKEVWAGFSKNIFPGLGKSKALALLLSTFYFAIFLLPFLIFIGGLFSSSPFLSSIPFLLVLAQKCIVDIFTKQASWNFLLFPLSVIATILVLFYSMFLQFSKRGFSWKGRTYS